MNDFPNLYNLRLYGQKLVLTSNQYLPIDADDIFLSFSEYVFADELYLDKGRFVNFSFQTLENKVFIDLKKFYISFKKLNKLIDWIHEHATNKWCINLLSTSHDKLGLICSFDDNRDAVIMKLSI